jgi:DNA-directed RNA polymerase subunit RPC12/RpoP
MDETPRPRKTLSLKGAVAPLVAAPPPQPEAQEVWKCKPCGAVVDLAGVSPGEDVRCGSCGARLGKLEAFLSGEEAPKVRARKAVLPPPPPPAPPPAPEIKARPKIVRPT